MDLPASLSRSEAGLWSCEWKLLKYRGDDLDTAPYEQISGAGNLVMNGGVSCIWECLEGSGSGTPGGSLTYFDNTNAAIGVGDSSTAAAATQTDLQAATNKLRVAMDATYPVHTDGVVTGSRSVVYQSTFSTSQANYAWEEWGVFNSATAATGRMLNRKVVSLGTKPNTDSWVFQVTLTIS